MTTNNPLIYNAIRTPDGTIIESRHRHDFVCHTDTVTGERYCVDGGLEYIRRVNWHLDCKELSLDDTEPHEVQRVVIKWGSYGKDGKSPLRLIPVGEMETDHILAVLKECRPALVYKNCMIEELKLRGVQYEKSTQA